MGSDSSILQFDLNYFLILKSYDLIFCQLLLTQKLRLNLGFQYEIIEALGPLPELY